jgi:hypothetical protein
MRHLFGINRRWLFVAALVWGASVGVGCLGNTSASNFVSVEIVWRADDHGQFTGDSTVWAHPRALTLTSQEDIRRLAAYFPGMGTGKRADMAGGWKAFAEFTFKRSEGTVVHLFADPDLKSWSEGHGDWPVNGDLAKELATLPWPQPPRTKASAGDVERGADSK